MSYCRWSSDNFRSDVYCYAHVDGTWTTHVAGNRVVGELPPDRWRDFIAGRISAQQFADSEQARHRILLKAERQPIGLPHDGETFKDGGPAEMRATLIALRALGYHVPDCAIARLEQECAESISA